MLQCKRKQFSVWLSINAAMWPRLGHRSFCAHLIWAGFCQLYLYGVAVEPLYESMKYLQSMRLTMTKDMFTTRMKGDAKSPKPILRLVLSLKNSTIKSDQCDTVTATVQDSRTGNSQSLTLKNAERLSQVEQPEPILRSTWLQLSSKLPLWL